MMEVVESEGGFSFLGRKRRTKKLGERIFNNTGRGAPEAVKKGGAPSMSDPLPWAGRQGMAN